MRDGDIGFMATIFVVHHWKPRHYVRNIAINLSGLGSKRQARDVITAERIVSD